MWPDMTKFRHFSLFLCTIFSDGLYWQWAKCWCYIVSFYDIGQIFKVVNGRILNNNLAIWSHWTQTTFCSLRYRHVIKLSFSFLTWVYLSFKFEVNWIKDRPHTYLFTISNSIFIHPVVDVKKLFWRKSRFPQN